jgi:large conductance mechanosensitive channel
MAEEKRRVVKRREVTMTLPVVEAPGWLQGFVNFFREQGVVGLAVGFTFGVAAKSLVDAIVNNVVNPIVGLMYGGGGQLGDKFWCLKQSKTLCTSKIGYGAVLSQVINLLVVALVIYFVIKAFKLDKLDIPKKT